MNKLSETLWLALVGHPQREELCDQAKQLEQDRHKLAAATIDFIDQMRVQGLEGNLLPAEYDTLVDVVKEYRADIEDDPDA